MRKRKKIADEISVIALEVSATFYGGLDGTLNAEPDDR